ncbi:TIR domain-containing protein [Pseudogulbenkiania sp. MAI-1]|uniref:TIR domain-containing protein n=1 Tax=Pseudogulbenkiania sp. MAI-1 TaxID=990370 RepID=UPI00045E9DA5|nr:nucleotide-binding protein [Pseudogulbenkiania sp. MAI-1]
MTELAVVMAKLAGIRKAILAVMDENVSRNRSRGEVLTRGNFPPDLVRHYFDQAADQLNALKRLLPDLYGDFQAIKTEPEAEMASSGSGMPAPVHYSRAQAERLVRDIDQIFEIRANSELAQPKESSICRVFISHGRSADWRAVQPFIERDVGIPTLELEQEPNLGRTIIEKLIDNAARCSSAVIVMTGDDVANEDEARVRENVMHEIGFFQGRYGRNSVVLLHEEGVNIPSNLTGVAYIPFPKGSISSGFHVLQRELKALYKL